MLRSSELNLILFEGQDYVKREHFVENFELLDKTYGELAKNNSEYVVTTGNANTYLATLDRELTGYYEGLCLKIKIHVDSTSNCTLNVNGLGAKYIKDSYGNIVTNLKKNVPYHVCYCEGAFILLGKGGGGNAQPSYVLENYTFTNDTGPQKGTMKNNGTKIFTPGRSNIALSGFYADGSYVKGEPNLIPENLVAGLTYFGIKGAATIESLGGYRFKEGSYKIPVSDKVPLPEASPVTIDCGFTPKFIMMIPRTIIDTPAIAVYYFGQWLQIQMNVDGNEHYVRNEWAVFNENGFTTVPSVMTKEFRSRQLIFSKIIYYYAFG